MRDKMAMSPPPETGSSAKETETRAQANKRDRQSRKYGFACANCRRRKARCNGGIPSCDRCLATNENCYFDKVPSVTYALALQDRIKASESILERLRNASEEERLKLLEDHFNSDNSTKPRRATSIDHLQQRDSPQSEVSAEDEVTELLNETSVGEDGRICFYGRTSLFHLQPEQTALSHPTTGTMPGSMILSHDAVPWRSAAHREGSFSLSAPSPSTSAQTDITSIINSEISQELFNELLDVYWCWPHHLHLVLCRKIFMRDLSTSGPYVTLFLLNSVLAQAARFSDRPQASKLSEHFARRALNALADEIDKGSSIPTIQGLLIFSARECASGRTSQGWLYSGMAFRMMRDLGIHIHPRSLSHLVGQFSPEDLALRQQIFWSCYTWDKTMSLCLGRAPTIHDIMPAPSSETWLDGDGAENEPWRPRFSMTSPSDVNVAQKARTNTRFSAYCQLCVMIDDVLDTLYSRPHAGQNHLQGYLDRTMGKLETWSKELPPHLYISDDSRAVSCPPLHILLLNLLYHATIILLCRPYRSTTTKARKTATKAAEMIDRLLTLHVRRFGFRVFTYLETYTVFVGATINILDLKEGKDEEAESASARLAFSMEILRNAQSTPSSIRCVEIIEQLLRKNEKSNETGGSDEATSLTDPSATNQQQQMSSSEMPTSSFVAYEDPTQPSVPRNPFTSTVTPESNAARVDDLPFFTMNNSLDLPSLYEQSTIMSDLNKMNPPRNVPSMRTNADPTVETPLRWLPDNVRDDCGWMMMGMDFANGFDDGLGRGPFVP